MNRADIEQRSREIVKRYSSMLNALNLSQVNECIGRSYDIDEYNYYKITEISNIWEFREKTVWELIAEVMVALHSMAAPISVAFCSDGKKLNVFLGGKLSYIENIKKAYEAVFPQMVCQRGHSGDDIITADEVLYSQNWNSGGFIKGNPTGTEKYLMSVQLEKVICAMKGKPWMISVFAEPISKEKTVARQHMWLTMATECSQFSDVSYMNNDTLETTTYKKNYLHSQQYLKKVASFCDKTEESVATGEWAAVINFSACSKVDAKLLGGLLTATYYGEESQPEPVHAIYQMSGYNLLTNPQKYSHCMFSENGEYGFEYPIYGNYISSRELAVFSSFPVIDTAGFTVRDYVNFDSNRTVSGDTSLGYILENGEVTQNEYLYNLDELNRHCLVIGLTGSGKTNTIKNLICSIGKLNEKSRPFMIIEPAKKEYWELYKLGFDDLRIYSIGSNESYAYRLCINPFERVSYKDENGRIKSVSIQTHIDFVFSAFKASFIMYTPMPYVLEKAIYSIYEDCGWDIDRNMNINGKEIYPTIEDLYYKIPEIVMDMGYDTKMRNDLIGSLQARINSLRMGSKGSALNVSKSFPIDHLLEGNTIVEIEDIGDDDVKAFIISLLMINILEYRRQQEDCQLKVRHLLFIEEAHRLLKNINSGTGENADPRGGAVEFFCNMLAEMRSKGQGFVVADQIPSKLAPDLIKNTNLKIVHRTVSEEERVLMGGSMNMTEEQTSALSVLRQGVAAVYSEGDYRPKLVNPLFAGGYTMQDRKQLLREDVLRLTGNNCINITSNKKYEVLTNKKKSICRACDIACEISHIDMLEKLVNPMSFISFARDNHPDTLKSCKIIDIDRKLDEFMSLNAFVGHVDKKRAKNCLMNCLLECWNLEKDNAKLKEKIERVYIKEILNKV